MGVFGSSSEVSYARGARWRAAPVEQFHGGTVVKDQTPLEARGPSKRNSPAPQE